MVFAARVRKPRMLAKIDLEKRLSDAPISLGNEHDRTLKSIEIAVGELDPEIRSVKWPRKPTTAATIAHRGLIPAPVRPASPRIVSGNKNGQGRKEHHAMHAIRS